jgi:hypothetical protein
VSAETRRAKLPERNAKGQCVVKVGPRSEYRVFKFSRSVSDKEVEQRRDRLKEVFDACGGWNGLSNFIAEHVRKGIVPVPLPDKELCGVLGVQYDGWVHWRAVLVNRLPTIPWASLGESTINRGVLGAIRHLAMGRLNEAAETIAGIDRTPHKVVTPIPGSLHEALKAYQLHVNLEDPANYDRHGKIRQLLERHPDQPLATLGIDACRDLYSYWRQRPHRHDGKGQYTNKRSREQLAELIRFLEWLHLSEEFGWREPEDFHRLDCSIFKDMKSRKSILQSKMPIFKIDDLATLVRHAGMPEKLWIVWCLNNSHGAAEVGRVQWEDIYLNQDHPWRAEGLNIWEGGNWTGFLRPKTDVLGWWLLWPETVELLLEWKERCRSLFGREVAPNDTLIVRESGASLYGMNKNAQSAFYNQFDRLKNQCERMGCPVADLPPGTLRNQFSDWCGGEEADATVASVALAHGIPHKGDKLLYKHYSNRPWKRLFEKQQEFREYCRPVLDAIKEKPPLPPKMREFLKLWPTLSGNQMERVTAAARALEVSNTTIYRYLERLPELKSER